MRRLGWIIALVGFSGCTESGQEPPDTDTMGVDSAADTAAGEDGSEVDDETSGQDTTVGETTADTDDAPDVPDMADVADTDDAEDTSPEDTAADMIDSADVSDSGELSDSGDVSDSLDADPDAVPAGCERFAITPEKAWLEPFGFTVFTALGASDARRFDLPGDVTGSSIHPSLGTFLAGPQSGVVSVRLSDPTCGVRLAELVVVEPLTILPAIASIEPSVSSLEFEVVGGSGVYELEMSSVDGHTPAATLSPDGRLFAGAVTRTSSRTTSTATP